MIHFIQILAQADKGLVDVSPLPQVGTTGAIENVVKIVLGITGAIALLIITIAGFQYITSRGNPQTVATAKNAIIYAGVGLVISALAFVIVAFVVQGTT